MVVINRSMRLRTTQHPFRVISCHPVPVSSPVVRPQVGIYGRHGFNCALPCCCDCEPAAPPADPPPVRVPDLFTSSRGFTYDLAGMLGDDGYYSGDCA